MKHVSLAVPLLLLWLSPAFGQFPESFEGAAVGTTTCNSTNPGGFPTGWASLGNNPFIIDTGGTGSVNTGPSAANTGANYVYLETSCGANPQNGELNLPIINANGLTNPTLDFAYHMFGATMGSLEVQVYAQCAWTTVWYLAGDQGNQWNTGQANLSAGVDVFGMVAVRFLGTRGTSFTSDMAIDDVDVSDPSAAVAVTTNPNPPTPAMNPYQVNGFCASSDVNGVQSNGQTPAVTRFATGATATFNLAGTPGLPYDVLVAAGALIPAGTAGSFVTGAGQIVNVPYLTPFRFWLNSGTTTPNFITQFGSQSFPFAIGAQTLASTQAVFLDPTSADGARLSQGTQFEVNACPPGLDLGLTDDSTSLQALGFSYNYFGTSYTEVYIGSNGHVHFGTSNSGWVSGAAGMQTTLQPTIAVWSEDFNPNSGGSVDFCTDGVQNFYVTWNGVPSFGITNTNLFSLIATSNPSGGSCIINWDISSQELEGTIGLTPGNTQPTTLVVSDLSTIPGVGLVINPGEIIVEDFVTTTPFDLLGVTLTWSLDPAGFPITIL